MGGRGGAYDRSTQTRGPVSLHSTITRQGRQQTSQSTTNVPARSASTATSPGSKHHGQVTGT